MSDATTSQPSVPSPDPNTVLTCDQCSPSDRNHCIQCHRLYCPHFESEIDASFCRLCLTSEAANVHVHALTDSEGIAHDGRWILPQGSVYKTLPRAISEMDDTQLEEYLRYMKKGVQDTETTLQYKRIALTTGEMEQEHRKMLADRRLRGIKLPTSANTGIKIAGASNKSPRTAEEKLRDVAATIKAMGITKEMLEALLVAKKKVQ